MKTNHDFSQRKFRRIRTAAQITKPILANTIEPALSEEIPEELADQELYQKVLARMEDKPNAIEVDLDDL